MRLRNSAKIAFGWCDLLCPAVSLVWNCNHGATHRIGRGECELPLSLCLCTQLCRFLQHLPAPTLLRPLVTQLAISLQLGCFVFDRANGTTECCGNFSQGHMRLLLQQKQYLLRSFYPRFYLRFYPRSHIRTCRPHGSASNRPQQRCSDGTD